MTPFVRVVAIAVPLMRANIDTDQITPGRTGMKVQKAGFGSGLFFNWRYLADGSDNPEFILNQQPYREAQFILAGPNFGCGSSREFAVWALRDFGIRAVVAPSFGSIFMSNCYVNGLLPIVLDETSVAAIGAEIAPNHAHMTVDLEKRSITSPSGRLYGFQFPALQRERMLEGLDAIDATLRREASISAFQQCDAA